MENNSTLATMDDVARLSGVSKGTVDRVLHDRGGVSEKTKKKVLQVIKEIGYMPNVYASILSQKRSYRIIAIIPYFQKGDYWEMVYDGIMSFEQNKNIHIDIDIIYYNQFDVGSFSKACSHTLALEPNAVLIAPIYKKEASVLVSKLSELSVPVVYIDTKLDNSNYLAYYGMPLFASGYLAAHLVFDGKEISEIVNFNVDRGGAAPNDSMINRYKGFMAYIEEHNFNCKVYDLSMIPHDFMYNIKLFESFFNEHPDVKHIITLNSRAYIISEWLEMRGIKDKKLLGFDMLEKNMAGVRNGYISVLIAERTALHVQHGMQALIDYLVFRKKPVIKDNLFSMDILNKYNVDYYTENNIKEKLEQENDIPALIK